MARTHEDSVRDTGELISLVVLLGAARYCLVSRFTT